MIFTAAFWMPAQAAAPAVRFHWLKFGEVAPRGWIKAQMERDLREGFAGKLDLLTPEVSSDIFGSGRNRPGKPNVAKAVLAGAEAAWWNGESEGNWWNGFIMMSHLAGDAESMRKAAGYVRHILDTQDRDGYIGIYSPELRFSDNPANGELWTQACVLRGLLAYQQFTGDRKVLEAVERAVRLTMQHYGPGRSTVFAIPKPLGGIGHALMFEDVLEMLYEITGDSAYRDFGVWLFDDFNKVDPKYGDATVAELLEPDKPWKGHGAHTFEHLRVPLWTYFVSGRPELATAWRNGFIKAGRYMFPSGALVSMEPVGPRPDPTKSYYEYCAMKEEVLTYTSGLQKTGRSDLGDVVEKVIFNAAQGARAARGMGVTYCTNDNRFRMAGELKNRNKFSPAHADVAVCCNPNAVQTMPLYVRAMWMKTPDNGLAAVLYGPSEVSTLVGGTRVTIKEQTEYPFSPRVVFAIEPERPVEFSLVLRDPGWSKETHVSAGKVRARRDGDYFILRKRWKSGDRVTVEFEESIHEIAAINGEFALARGPLVYCLRIPETGRSVKTYEVAGFADMHYSPADSARWNYALASAGAPYGFQAARGDGSGGFEGAPLRLSGRLINRDTGQPEAVSLIPMGSSLAVLRRVTFPVSGN